MNAAKLKTSVYPDLEVAASMSQGLESNSWNSTGTNEPRIFGSLGSQSHMVGPSLPQMGDEDTDMFTLDLEFEQDMDVEAAAQSAVDFADTRVHHAPIQHLVPRVSTQPPWGSAPALSQHWLQAVSVRHDPLPLYPQRQSCNVPSAELETMIEQQLYPEHHKQQHITATNSQWMRAPLPQSQAGFGISPSLTSALRSSRTIPGVDSTLIANPPVWVSGDGTPCTSPPVVSPIWGLSSMISIPEAAPSQTALKWSSEATCSLPAGSSGWLHYDSCAGSPSAQHAAPHLVPQTMQMPLTQPCNSRLLTEMHYGSAPNTWSGAARSNDQLPSSPRVQFGAKQGELNAFGEPVISGLGGHNIAWDLKCGGASGTSSHPVRQQHPRSAPPLAPLRVSTRLQGRGKQTYSEYDRDAFSRSESESESEIGSHEEGASPSPAPGASPAHQQRHRGAVSSEDDISPIPGLPAGALSSSTWARRLDKQQSLGAPGNASAATSVGSGGFVSRSGRTVKPGLRAYSPTLPRELSASLPRNYGASVRTSGSGGGTIKRKRAIHAPAALRESLEADMAGQRRKQHNPWTREETEALVEGVHQCGGAGKWQDIKRLGLLPLQGRSAVDLKDKWRNLLRVAELPPVLLSARADRKREGPSSLILDRVRELAVVTLARAAASETRIPSSRPRARGRLPPR